MVTAAVSGSEHLPNILWAENHQQHCQALVGRVNATAVPVPYHNDRWADRQSRLGLEGGFPSGVAKRYSQEPAKYTARRSWSKLQRVGKPHYYLPWRKWLYSVHPHDRPNNYLISSNISLLPRFPRSSGRVPWSKRIRCMAIEVLRTPAQKAM